ncbi:MFS transporter [Phytomonospora sp. NPDC050363]|uniref:MFS transporter n=1 Tax=Phytomonospora sp. NPDC050363 TaxID=3155642 RepID=UPI003408FB66
MTTATRPAPAPPRTRLLPTVLVLAPPALLATGQLYLGIPLVPAVGADWQVPATTATAVLTVFGFGYAAGVLTFGVLVDRLGPRRVMTRGLLAASFATLAVVLAVDPASGYALRALQGFAVGAFPPAAFAYVGAAVPAHRRGVVLSCLTGGFLAAGGLAQLAGQGVVALGSWRLAFAGGAVLLAASALAVRLVLLPDPRRASGTTVARLHVGRELRGLYAAAFTLLIAFVTVYTGLQLAGRESLPLLRLCAVPAVLVAPFLIGRLPVRPALRAAGGLGTVAVIAAVIAVTGERTSLAGLAFLLFALTLGVAVAAPSLAEAVGLASGSARAFGAGVFNAALLIGASVAGPIATALNGLSTSVFLAAAVTFLGAGAAFCVSRDNFRKDRP